MNAFMESTKPSVYTSGNAAGIDRVRKEDGLYAFFMEAAAIEYHIQVNLTEACTGFQLLPQRKCDLRQLGGLLDSKGYAIAMPKNSPYSATISQGVIRLIEKVSEQILGRFFTFSNSQGVMNDLKKKWWVVDGDDACKDEVSRLNQNISI